MEYVRAELPGVSPSERNWISKGLQKRSAPKVKLVTLMAAVVVAHRLNDRNYVGRGQGPTAIPDLAERYVTEGPTGVLRVRLSPSMEDLNEASQIIIWIRSQENVTDRYQLRLKEVFRQQYIPFSEIGVAASAIRGFSEYRKHQGAVRKSVLEARAREDQLTEARFGRTGEEVAVTAHVVFTSPVINDWSDYPRELYILRSSEGRILRWYASETQGVEVGDLVSLTGKVKGHQTFVGEPQTELWYCKNVRIHPPVQR